MDTLLKRSACGENNIQIFNIPYFTDASLITFTNSHALMRQKYTLVAMDWISRDGLHPLGVDGVHLILS
jgi:hypothetical protein